MKAFAIFLFLVALFSSFFVFIAPGNELRARFFENNHQFINSIFLSFLQTIRFIFAWISNLPFILLSFLFIVVTKEKNENIEILNISSYRKLILLSLLIPFVVFLCIFPAYWSTGILGQQRTVNVACFLFIVLWFIILSLWINYYRENPILMNIEKSLKKRSLKILFIISLITMLVTKNGYNTFTDIFYNKVYNFNKEMNERYDLIAEAKRKSSYIIVFKPLLNKPSAIFILDLTSDSSHWINSGYQSFYGLKSITVKNN